MLIRKKNVHIIHIISSCGFYGAEKVVYNLCKTELCQRTSVVCLVNDVEVVDSFKKHVLDTGSHFYAIQNSATDALSQLKALIRSDSYLVVHAHGYKPIFIAWLFSKSTKCKIIVTQHGFVDRSIKSKIYNLVDMSLCRLADIEKILCVSPDIYRRYRRFGVPERRLLELPNGIEIPAKIEKEEAKRTIRSTYSTLIKAPIILYVGRFSEEKDPELFLDVLHYFKKNDVKFNALMAGSGHLESALIQKIDHLGLSNCTKLLGYVEDIDNLFASADIMLVTSKSEGTPISIIEAMAQDCLVISSSVGGVSNMICHKVNGILVSERSPKEFFEYCMEYLGSYSGRLAITRNANNLVREKYAISKQTTVYQKIYGIDK